MATHAHSTRTSIEHRGFDDAVPVPMPALTATTVDTLVALYATESEASRDNLMAAGLLPPAALPSLQTAFSRRKAIFGAVALAAAPAVALPAAAVGNSQVAAQLAPLSPDARLVELADAYEVLDREVDLTPSNAPGYNELIDRYEPIEDELAETPAVTMAGVLAKARVVQFRTCRECVGGGDIGVSIADDLVRIFGGARG